MSPDPDATTPTIYEWAGGRPAFARWFDVFYDLVEGDELLAPMFGGRVTAEHRANVTTWWCEVMGGPAEYSEDHGGYAHMLSKYRGLGITAEQRLRFVTLLSRAADDAGLPADPEFRAAVNGLCGVGNPPCPTQLPAGCGAGEAGARSALGVGGGSAVPAIG